MRVGLVTCAVLPEPDHDEELTLGAFRDSGHECEMIAWDGGGSAEGLDLLIIRSPWNYYLDPQGFLSWLEAAECPLLNPLELVRWNISKNYLLQLQKAGIPVVPTLIFANGTVEPNLDQAWPGNKIVIKPTISAGSWKTKVFHPRERDQALSFLKDQLVERHMMVQPYLRSVETEGEHSLIWIDGRIRHFIRKAPRFDDQDESITVPEDIGEDFVELAYRVMEEVQGALYARVDIMRGEDGQLLLSELELIEPSLFFKQAPGSLGHLVSGALSVI